MHAKTVRLVTRGRDQRVAGRENPRNVPAKAEKGHAAGETVRRDPPSPARKLCAGTHHDELRVPRWLRAQLPPRLVEHVEALAPFTEGTDEHDAWSLLGPPEQT